MKKGLSLTFIILFAAVLVQAQTWSQEYMVSSTGFGSERPRIALMSNNTPIVLWGDGQPNNIVYTARWNGAGFDAPVRVHSDSTEVFTDFWAGPDIATSGDTIFIGKSVV